MTEDAVAGWGQFEELRSRGLEAVEDGRFEEAEGHYRQAFALAQERGEQRFLDLATCNLAAVAIQCGDGERELPRLREILLRSDDPANCRLAAYHISVHYQLARNYKKSAFYARIALDRARLLGRADWLASCHNQLGNALLSETVVDEAVREYRRSLELLGPQPSVWQALILDNLGYCRVLQGDYGEGYALLYRSLRMLRRLGSVRPQPIVLLDLAFTHLETSRYNRALRCAEAGLALAEKTGQVDQVKNGLYLLGEAANLSGDTASAQRHFSRLQKEFYPDASYLPGFLMAVDVRRLVNLHA